MIVQLMGTIRPDNKSQGSVRMTSQITEERNATYVKMTQELANLTANLMCDA